MHAGRIQRHVLEGPNYLLWGWGKPNGVLEGDESYPKKSILFSYNTIYIRQLVISNVKRVHRWGGQIIFSEPVGNMIQLI